MSANADMNRRSFLKLSAFTGALVLGFRLPETNAETAAEPPIMNMASPHARFEPNAYLVINADNTVLVRVHRSEMGQGVNTSVPMIIADELEADWRMIRIEQAPADRVYGDQVTGGSVSMSGSFSTLRAAAAAARTMLVSAAALTWGVDPAACRAESGMVIHADSGESLRYGELAETAATLPVPGRGEFTLKDPADFKLIGTSMGNFDNPGFVNGSAQFCSDLKLPGMLVAAVLHCPFFDGSLASYDSSETEAVPGVRHVVEIPDGLAVVADNTWAALKGREALKVTWDEGSDRNSAQIATDLLARVKPANDPAILEAVYQIPYLAHATMEPMVCVADVRADGCDVWAPTQDRQRAKSTAQAIAKLPAEAVHIHVPLMGGAFGRRLQVDYVSEAVMISKAVSAPVKVFWTRAEDMQHDYYHPLSINPRSVSKDSPYGRYKGGSSQGRGVPTGAWRSVGEFTNAWANECFADEVAAAIGQDPLEYRLQVHARTKREAVLRLAAEKAGWDTPLPEGWGRGIAVHSTFGATHVAHVAEVSVGGDGSVRVQRVVCAVDCGLVINPDNVKAQMQGGIIFGLSAILHGEITVENGRTQQSNFHDYPVVRMNEAPQIEVYIVASEATSPTGVGEMAVPPIAPAVANAIFSATGQRVRKIPVRPEDIKL